MIILLTVMCPQIALIWADKGYRGTFVEQARQVHLDVDIVSDEQSGFHVQKRRWVVERTFAWLNNYRRLSKDYEHCINSSEGMIYIASSHTMLKRFVD